MIEIVPYRSEWPVEFRTLAQNLRAALGDLAQRIDHIGSTSVPGLEAKDIIDVQITVKALAPELKQALERLGYVWAETITADHVPPGGPEGEREWQKWYFRPPAGMRPTHTHVRIAGRANQRYALLFRDYLRATPRSAEAYARLKRLLAAYHGDDRVAYTEIKDPACDLIHCAAEAWAEQTGWTTGPGDARTDWTPGSSDA